MPTQLSHNQRLSIDADFSAMIVIEKSRFISYIYPISSTDAAIEILVALRKKYHDATHVCYAYVIDGYVKFSDDGEPKDTAGQPILEVIKGRGLEGVLVAVVRYFGGIKLGTGGLVRAYTDSAIAVIERAEVFPLANVDCYKLELSYPQNKSVRKAIANAGGMILDEKFAEMVELEFYVPSTQNDKLIKELSSIFSAKPPLIYKGNEQKLIKNCEGAI